MSAVGDSTGSRERGTGGHILVSDLNSANNGKLHGHVSDTLPIEEDRLRQLLAEELELRLEPLLDALDDLVERTQAAPPGQLLDARQVCSLVGVHKRTLRRRVAAGAFPQPLLVGKRSIRWPREQVMAWVEQQAGHGRRHTDTSH